MAIGGKFLIGKFLNGSDCELVKISKCFLLFRPFKKLCVYFKKVVEPPPTHIYYLFSIRPNLSTLFLLTRLIFD